MSNIRDYLELKEQMDYTQLPNMSGQEIAKELGITRMAVSNTLKRALKKLHTNVKKELKMNDFEAAVAIQIGMNVDNEDDIKSFFKLFPPDVRKKIEASAVVSF